MSERRPRNAISRSKVLSLRAAELYDDGATDAEVAAALNNEHADLVTRLNGKKLSSRTANSFFKADYEPVAQERIARRNDALQARLIVEAATGSGAGFAQAGQDILAKMIYDLLQTARDSGEQLDTKAMAAAGKSLGKIMELNLESEKLRIHQEKEAAAQAMKNAISGNKMTSDELVHEVDKIMGLAR